MKFKIILPAGYQVKDYYDDNLDINVVLENTEVFFSTIFTLENVKKLMDESEDLFFWADNMIIIRDLKKETIRNFVFQALNSGNFHSMFYRIGELTELEGYSKSYDDFDDFSTGRDNRW